MQNPTNERLMQRLEHIEYTPRKSSRAATSQFAPFIVEARRRYVPWSIIAKLIREEAGVEIKETALRVWWSRRNANVSIQKNTA